MSLFTTFRAVDRSPMQGDFSAEDANPPPAKHVKTEASLPRHLLVSLAGITGEVTSLQQRCVDAPDLHAALERILGRLDGLVDSIYQHAADPAGSSAHRSDLAADSASDALVVASDTNAHTAAAPSTIPAEVPTTAATAR